MAGSVSDSYEMRLPETIRGLCKAEFIHSLGPGRSIEAVEYARFVWVNWNNTHRRLAPFRKVPPVAAEANDQTALETEATAT